MYNIDGNFAQKRIISYMLQRSKSGLIKLKAFCGQLFSVFYPLHLSILFFCFLSTEPA